MSLLAETSALLGDTDSAAVLYGLLRPWAALNAADQPEGIRGSVVPLPRPPRDDDDTLGRRQSCTSRTRSR